MVINLKTQFSLTLTPDPGGAIVLSDGSVPAAFLDSGSQVTLTAAPMDGFVFTGWEGDCSGTDACQVSMDQPKSVIAHFQAKN